MILKLFYKINTWSFHLWTKIFYPKSTISKNVKINKWPILNVKNGGSIKLEKNVLLNSSNRTYHVNMYSRVKLQCDKPNAKIVIGENSRIHGSCIHAFQYIEIGKNCLIAANCQIIDSNGHAISIHERKKDQGKSNPVIIGENVWLGTGCIILPGVKIGNNSIIAAGSVVNGEVPANSIFGGNPATFIRYIS